MIGTIRSALVCAGICFGIFLAAQLLRSTGALSFLPESSAGRAAAVMGQRMIGQSWAEGLTAVFSPVGK